MNKLNNIKLHFTIFIFFLGLFLGMNFSLISFANENAFRFLDNFHFVYQTIKSDYVETPVIKKLFDGAIGGMISSLNDPYSRYLDEVGYSQFKQSVTGKFVGIGVEVSEKNNEIIVISAIEDTPAQKAGIQTGDVIVKINDKKIKNKSLNDIVKIIKGKPGSSLRLHVRREGFPELLEFSITRAPIKVASIKYGLIKENSDIGYIKINHFYSETAADFENALKKLNEQKIKKIIIDLRQNPGGDMDAAISIADQLLEKKKIIVSTKGREGSGIKEEYTSKFNPLYKGKLALLVDNGSASASEILSGAVKDNNRAKLIGRQTFGKALVQKLIDIEPNKTGFTLTIRKYYTPSGAMIHKKGITPDYKIDKELIPVSDRKNLSKILNNKIIENFSKENSDYTDENKEKLVKLLNEKKLPIDKTVSNFYFKRFINMYKTRPLYDLEFDEDMKKAIEVINE